MDPTTIMVIGAVSAAIGAGGSIMSGISQSNMAKYNAEVARRSAETARKAGEFEYARRQEAGAEFLSKQRTLYGAAGVETEGSPLLVMAETAGKVERDALAARYNYQVKASQAESQAGLYEMMAPNLMMSGLFSGASSLLKGGYDIFKPYQPSPLTEKV
jgi:hypothetical protein